MINAGGWIVQVLLHLILIPVVIRYLGMDAFGIYTIVLTMIGYFSIVQGINQATLKYVSEYISRNDHSAAQESINAALFLSLLIGVTGTVFIYSFAGTLATDVFRIPVDLQQTARTSFEIVSVGFVPTTLGLTLASIPQAHQRYEVPNVIMVSSGIVNLMVTLALVWNGFGIEAIVALNVILSFINALALSYVSKKLMRGMAIRPSYSKRQFTAIIKFSVYSFGSSVSGTIVHHLDRLVIAVVSGTAAVAVYAVSQLPMTRLATLVSKLCEVLVPEASRLSSTEQLQTLERTYVKASKYVLFLTITAFTPLIVLADPILRHWVGSEVALQGTSVMMLLGLGFLIRSQSSIPTVVNLGLGRPQVNAMFSFANLVIVSVFIYPAITMYGLVGVAFLSVVGSMNAPLFIYVTNKKVLLHGNRDYVTKVIPRPVLVGGLQCGFVLAFIHVNSAAGVLAVIIASVVLSGVLSWFLNVIDVEDRNYVRARVAALVGHAS